MSHTFTKNHQHIVFSTAKRRKLIDKPFQPRLWAYIAGICRNHGIYVRAIGGIEDHVHMLIELPPTLAVAQAVLKVKIELLQVGQGNRKEICLAEGICRV